MACNEGDKRPRRNDWKKALGFLTAKDFLEITISVIVEEEEKLKEQKQMLKNKTAPLVPLFKNKVCRCEIGRKSRKLDDITASLDSGIKSYEIGSVLLPKEEKLSLWEKIKKCLNF